MREPTCRYLCITGNRCELTKGHTGQCRFTYPCGAQEWWVGWDWRMA